MTPDVYNQTILIQIPGVSLVIANTILKNIIVLKI